MHILITGASGFIGSHLLQGMLDLGHRVSGCVRDPRRAHRRWPQVRFLQADFSRDVSVADWLPRLHGVDLVINAVGIIREGGTQRFDLLHRDAPIALFRACVESGVRRVIQISALGADETAFSHYHLSKKAADDALTDLDLEWTILMPSIVYGPGAKSMAFFKAMACLPFTPLVERGEQLIQPIHIDDLSLAVAHIVASDSVVGRRLQLVGPEPVTLKRLFSGLRQWLGLGPPRFLSFSYATSLRLARLGGFLGDTPMNGDAVAMLQRGNTGEVAQFVDTFSFLPKSLEQVLQETPAQESDRWHGGLYFLRPLLRLGIAFVWLFTGLISAFVIPLETSYGLLAKAGIAGIWAPITLYGAAAVDILLGLAVLGRVRGGLTGTLQILLILIYTLIITFSQPEQWLHPFGPVTKNAPMIAAVLVWMVLERRS